MPVALLLLGSARLAIAILPLRSYRRWLGHPVANLSALNTWDMRTEGRARVIERAVRARASIAPWSADCLPQAMAAAALLRLAGISYRLSIGWPDKAAVTDPRPMLAHAWVEAGNLIVTGAPIQPDLQARLVFED